MPRWFSLLLLVWIAFSGEVFARERWQAFLTEEQFAQLGADVAHRVDLFSEIWRQDPAAELYGGTSRDLYWFVRGQLARCTTQACVDEVSASLRTSLIAVEEVIAGESDIDLIATEAPVVSLRTGHLTKIDVIPPAWVQEGTAFAKQESMQGGLAVEKIRLGSKGVIPHIVPELTHGIRQIYEGVPKLHFDERIAQTAFYQHHGNHPILIVLRYLRQVAAAYSHRWGSGAVQTSNLKEVIDDPSWKIVETQVAALLARPSRLTPFLANAKFFARLGRVLKKMFRSYLNPNAAQTLFRRAKLPALFAQYGNLAPQYQSVLFAKPRNSAALVRDREVAAGFGVRLKELKAHVPKVAPGIGAKNQKGDGGALLHGTPDEADYRLICYQGIIPSSGGSAGFGAYAVDANGEAFAYRWKSGHAGATGKSKVVRLVFTPEATLLDLTGAANNRMPSLARALGVDATIDAVADALGADVVKYTYSPSPTGAAYVVKNGAAILRAEPYSNNLRSFASMKAAFEAARSAPSELLEDYIDDPFANLAFDALTEGFREEEKFAIAQTLFPNDWSRQIPLGLSIALKTRTYSVDLRRWVERALRATATQSEEKRAEHRRLYAEVLLSTAHLRRISLADILSETNKESHELLRDILSADDPAVRTKFAQLLQQASVLGKVSDSALQNIAPFVHAVLAVTVATAQDATPFTDLMSRLKRVVPDPVRARAALTGAGLAGVVVEDSSFEPLMLALDAGGAWSTATFDELAAMILTHSQHRSPQTEPILRSLLPTLRGRSKAFGEMLWQSAFRRLLSLGTYCPMRQVLWLSEVIAPPAARRDDGESLLLLRGRLARDLLPSNIGVGFAPEVSIPAAKLFLASEDKRTARIVERPFAADFRKLKQESPHYREMLALMTSADAFRDTFGGAYELVIATNGFREARVARDINLVEQLPEPLRQVGITILRKVFVAAIAWEEKEYRQHVESGRYRSESLDVADMQLLVPLHYRVRPLRRLAAQPAHVEKLISRLSLSQWSRNDFFRWEDAMDVLVGWSKIPMPEADFERWQPRYRYLLSMLKWAPGPPPRGWGAQLVRETRQMPEDHPLRRIIPELRTWPKKPVDAPEPTCGDELAS